MAYCHWNNEQKKWFSKHVGSYLTGKLGPDRFWPISVARSSEKLRETRLDQQFLDFLIL